MKYFLWLINVLTGGFFKYCLEQSIINKLNNLDYKKQKEFEDWYLNSDIKRNVELKKLNNMKIKENQNEKR